MSDHILDRSQVIADLQCIQTRNGDQFGGIAMHFFSPLWRSSFFGHKIFFSLNIGRRVSLGPPAKLAIVPETP